MSRSRFDVPHRIDNQAPLWMAEPADKQARTYFARAGIPRNKKVRASINQAMAHYKGLDNDGREQYLNERMSEQKHDGSVFIELKGQSEVVANRDLQQWEILGHYVGKHYNETSCLDGVKTIGAALTVIDRYNFYTSAGQFISGFRGGNDTSLIDSCTTHDASKTNRDLPELNVSYMRHMDGQGRCILFLIALKAIKAGDRLWADYGKLYWDAMREPIVVTDNADDEGHSSAMGKEMSGQ